MHIHTFCIKVVNPNIVHAYTHTRIFLHTAHTHSHSIYKWFSYPHSHSLTQYTCTHGRKNNTCDECTYFVNLCQKMIMWIISSITWNCVTLICWINHYHNFRIHRLPSSIYLSCSFAFNLVTPLLVVWRPLHPTLPTHSHTQTHTHTHTHTQLPLLDNKT